MISVNFVELLFRCRVAVTEEPSETGLIESMVDWRVVESETPVFRGLLVRTMPPESLARANITSLFAARIESDANVSENFPFVSVLNGEEYARYSFVADGNPNTYA